MYEKNITPSEEQIREWKKGLGEVFNRGFWHGGYYLGEKTGEWACSGENKATKKKVLCGKVLNYFPKAKIAQILLTSGEVKKGDSFLITGPSTGAEEGTLTEFHANDLPAEKASKGMEITFPFDKTVRKNDSFFLLLPQEKI